MRIRGLARSILTISVMIPATAAYAALVWLLAVRRADDPRIESAAKSWAQQWFRLSGATLSVSGTENVDPSRSYVIVSNHQSAFDIFSHFIVFPLPIRYLAKKELFRIPIFGSALRAIGIVEVDRMAGGSVHAHINRSAKEAINLGRSLIVYPEGTRPRDGVMRPFKKGAFTIAASMGTPILPTAITGSRKVWRPTTRVIRPGHIHVEIYPPIETAGLTGKEIDELRDRVHSIISTKVNAASES